MSGYAVSTAKGRIAAGEVDSIWVPRSPRGGYGVVLCHGSGNPQGFIDLTAQPASVRLAGYLASRGIPCIAGDFAYDSWGNDTAISRVNAARSVLAAAVPRMDTSKVFVLGGSMGGALAARWSQLNPAACAGVVGLIPAFDVRYEWENIAATRTPIGAAWGVTYPSALPATIDLQANAHLAAGVPLLAAYSSVDTIVPPAPVAQYVATVGGTGLVVDDVSGHTDATVAKLDPAIVYQFLAEHGA